MSEPKQKFRHNDGRGSLFINDYKENDRHPDLTGKAMIGGQEYNIALWKDQTQDGKFKGNLKFDLADAFKEHMEGGVKEEKVDPLFTDEDLIFNPRPDF